MNIVLKTGKNQGWIVADRNNKGENSPTPLQVVIDDFEDIFNEQVWLSNAFKQNIASAITNIDFAYPDDGENIKKMVHEYFQSSLQLLKNKLAKAQVLVNTPKTDGLVISINEAKNEPSFAKWTELWIEQTDDNNDNFLIALHCKPENEKYNSGWVGEWINQIEPVLLQA